MAMHGQHVAAFVCEADPDHRRPLDWFLGSAAALCNLTRLEVAQRDSLALLAPVLDQLPQLQHLAAHAGLTEQRVGYGAKKMAHLGPPITRLITRHAGSFTKGGRSWEYPPDLQRLCPQLLHLQLTLEPGHHSVYVDSNLDYLLPEGLQQLTLINTGGYPGEDHVRACRVWLSPKDLRLGHHPALQQLLLHDVRLSEHEGDLEYLLKGGSTCDECDLWEELDEGEVYERPPLQLCVHLSHTTAEDRATLRQLAPVLTECKVPSMADVSVLSDCAPLTRLEVSWGPVHEAADTLAALTGLVELDLGECGRLAAAVEQAASMPALRSLSVQGSMSKPAALSSSLACCTQLTSLGLLLSDLPAEWEDSDGSESADESEDEYGYLYQPRVRPALDTAPVVSSLQQLTGLRCLTVPAMLLGTGAWLVPLTALARLRVQLPNLVPIPLGFEQQEPDFELLCQNNKAEARRLLGRVPVWPTTLQHVVFQVASPPPDWDAMEVRPCCWEHSIAGPGSRQLKVWLELPGGAAQGWPRPFQPWPHLRGVWELQAVS
jgi:hypothetical protein